MKNIFLLGSTGSIGRITLDVVREHSDKFCAKVLVTYVNVELLIEQIEEFKPESAVVYDKQTFINNKSRFDKLEAKIFQGFPRAPVPDCILQSQILYPRTEDFHHLPQ